MSEVGHYDCKLCVCPGMLHNYIFLNFIHSQKEVDSSTTYPTSLDVFLENMKKRWIECTTYIRSQERQIFECYQPDSNSLNSWKYAQKAMKLPI